MAFQSLLTQKTSRQADTKRLESNFDLQNQIRLFFLIKLMGEIAEMWREVACLKCKPGQTCTSV